MQEQVGIKQKIVSKVKSWSGKEGKKFSNVNSINLRKIKADSTEISSDMESLKLSPKLSDNYIEKSELLKAKDSLENFTLSKPDKDVISDMANFKAFKNLLIPRSKCLAVGLPHSDSILGETSKESAARIIKWDPWNKLSRKSKKENKRRKLEKSSLCSREEITSSVIKTIDHKAGDEAKPLPKEQICAECSHNSRNIGHEGQQYEYSYRRKTKAVEFVKDVVVVYFTNNEEITKAIEPLKKELEQQIRNKEMRRGHIPCTMLGKKQISSEDYMATWFTKN